MIRDLGRVMHKRQTEDRRGQKGPRLSEGTGRTERLTHWVAFVAHKDGGGRR